MKNIILKVSEKKSIFSQAFEVCNYEDISVITVKQKSSAVRKIARKEAGNNIIISQNDCSLKMYENKIREYCHISNDVAFALIDKLCRQTANKFMLNIPFGEIYIAAAPHIACSLIAALNGLSRLFTVVSPQDGFGKMYDELYFKHGSIIRHIPSFNSHIREDTVIIRCSDEEVPIWENVPVIDMYQNSFPGKRGISLKNIYVYDEKIAHIQKEWGGQSGAILYTLTKKIPDKNAVVDIDRKSDKIFLLDTEVF